MGDLLSRPLVADDDDDDAAPAPRATLATAAAAGTTAVVDGSACRLLPALEEWRECEADDVNGAPANRVGVTFA